MRRTNLSRRGFLKSAALGAAAVTVQPILSGKPLYAAGPGIAGRFMVVINMLGGSDGLNVVIPSNLQPYVDRRPNINLVNNLPAGEALHDLDGSLQLHYRLDNIKALWDAGDVHVVNKVSYPNPNQSHFTSQDIYSYGVRDNLANGDGRGWLGRFADEYCASPEQPLGVISVGVGRRRDFESEQVDPLVLNNVEGFQVTPDTAFPDDHNLRVQTMRDALGTDPIPPTEPGLTIFGTTSQAYDLVEQVQAETAGWVDPGTYDTPPAGTGRVPALYRYMKTISQLLHANDTFGTRVFYTGFGGHDTHSAQINRQEALMRDLDGAIGVFSDDLKAKNLWDRCVVVVISEFGRRVFENGSTGTDHGHGNCFLVAGGGVKGKNSPGGGITGDIVEADLEPPRTTLPFTYDFRDVYIDIVGSHLGIPNSGPMLFPDGAFTPSPGDIDVV